MSSRPKAEISILAHYEKLTTFEPNGVFAEYENTLRILWAAEKLRGALESSNTVMANEF